jgi:hypothetical protein
MSSEGVSTGQNRKQRSQGPHVTTRADSKDPLFKTAASLQRWEYPSYVDLRQLKYSARMQPVGRMPAAIMCVGESQPAGSAAYVTAQIGQLPAIDVQAS